MLARALKASAAAAGFTAEVRDVRVRPWSSATFTGERVRLELHVGCDAASWLTKVREADLPISGWYVADLTAEAGGGALVVEALLLRDA